MKSQDVLVMLRKIPKGKVSTYKELAEALGTRGYRAVGQILRRNPRPDLYPCYKIVRSDGSLGGYDGKDENSTKRMLLENDGIKVVDGKVDMEKHLFRMR